MTSPAPGCTRPEQNAFDYREAWDLKDADPFSSEENLLSREHMGSIPAAVLAHPERQRGNHPICSFTALGQLARMVIRRQSPTDVFAPLLATAELGGAYVLAGVNLTRATFIHAAEEMMGRRPFVRWARGQNDEVIEAFCGGCSEGFQALEKALQPAMRTGYYWRVCAAEESLRLAADAIAAEPGITHCGNHQCERCPDAVKGGPILT